MLDDLENHYITNSQGASVCGGSSAGHSSGGNVVVHIEQVTECGSYDDSTWLPCGKFFYHIVGLAQRNRMHMFCCGP